MLSLEKKFLFVHIPKTGGNSIQNILKKYSEDEIIITHPSQDGVERFAIKNKKYKFGKHATLTHYKNIIEPDIYASLFKIACLRNPWERVISHYFTPFFKEKHICWNRGKFLKFLKTLKPSRFYMKLYSENIFLSKLSAKVNIPLSPYYYGDLTNDIDFLIRFEHLNKDFKTICEKIDIPYEELPVRNKSNRKHYSKYYDNELIEIVRRKYSDEIEFMGYTFESE